MGARDEYVKAIKSAFVTIGKGAAMTALIAEVPFFGLPIIRTMTSYLVGWVLQALTDATEMGAYFMYTDFRVNAQGNEFIVAALNNQKVQASGTKEEKIASEKELLQKFADFVRISS